MFNDELEEYRLAKMGEMQIKAAVLLCLRKAGPDGLRLCDVGRRTGMYAGYRTKNGGQEFGHLVRVILERLMEEGLVAQREDKTWFST